MKRKKVVIIIPCWKRAEVAGLVFKQFDVLFETTKSKIDLMVIYIFSLSDPELKELINHYKSSNHPRDYIYSANARLGQKINDGIDYASRYQYDYIMNSGSDDLIHPNIIDLYLPFINDKVLIFGLNKLYFHKQGEHPIFFSYYNTPHVIGAGRMIHKKVIQSVLKQYPGLYAPDINRGMDTMSAKRMHEFGFEQTVIDPGEFPMIVDIKSDVNINSFEELLYCNNSLRRVAKCSIDILTKEFELLNTPDHEITTEISSQENNCRTTA
jgi:hypothetical protein